MRATSMAMLSAAALLAACAGGEESPATGTGAGDSAGTASGETGISGGNLPPPGSVEYFNVVVGDRVFFGFDRHDLDAEARATLSDQAEWLRGNPGTRVTVEGHADERGTRAYNLALGARRANAARRFLVAEGVEPGRIETVSYGKERPVALCSDESCWSQNRRAVTVVAGAPAS